MKVNLGNEEYTIQFATKPTLKSNLIQDVVQEENDEGGNANEQLKNMLLVLIPKMLLVGLQMHHSDKFGYDYDTDEGFDAKLSEVCDLFLEKVDAGEINYIDLRANLEKEMEDNSFLSQLLEAFRYNLDEKKPTAKKTTPKKAQIKSVK